MPYIIGNRYYRGGNHTPQFTYRRGRRVRRRLNQGWYYRRGLARNMRTAAMRAQRANRIYRLVRSYNSRINRY